MGVTPTALEHTVTASAIATVDGEGTIVGLNDVAELLLGVSEETVRGRSFAEVAVPPDLRELYWSSLLGVVSGRTPLREPAHFRTRVRGSAGSQVCVQATVLRSGSDPLELTVYATPVPEDQLRLERAERLLDIHRRVARISGWEYDLINGDVIHSPGQLALLGLPEGELQGPLAPDDIPFVTEEERQRFAALQREVLAEPERFVGEMRRFLTRVRAPDGSIRALLVSSEVSRDSTGAPHWFTGALQDVTATRSTEQQIEAVHAVRRVIEGWDDDTGFGDLIAALGTTLEAPMAALWTERDTPGELWCRSFWCEANFECADLEAGYRKLPIRRGSGATGRAYASGHAEYEEPDPRSPYGPTALEAGLRQVLAFPAHVEGEVLAVVALGWTEQREISDRLLATFDTIGAAVGRFLHSRRGELGQQPLSRRELQVLRLAAEGQTGPEIAQRLGLSPATIKTHFKNVYEKLGTTDRAAAVAQAFRLGLLR